MASADLWLPDRIVVHSLFAEKDLVRQVPGARWDKDFRTWWVPLSWASCVALRGVFGEGLGVGDPLNEWALREYGERVEPCTRLRLAEDYDPDFSFPLVYTAPDGSELEPLQRSGAQFLAVARHALNGDGCGSGKTLQLICAVESLAREGHDVYPALVLCNNSALYDPWLAEIEKWAPGRSVSVITGGAAKRRKLIEARPDWLIMPWSLAASHSRLAPYGHVRLSDKEKEPKELNGGWVRTVIGDEAHRARNPKAKQTRAWWYLSWEADMRLACTGTPVERSPEDLWSIMHGVSPEEFPTKSAFIDRYCYLDWSGWTRRVAGLHPERKEELYRFLDARYIHRPTKLVVPNLGNKLPPQYRRVDLPPKQAKAYAQMEKEMLAEVDGGVAVTTSVFGRLRKLLDLAAAYGEIGPDGEFHLTEPSAKLDALDDLIEELTCGSPWGEQLVVLMERKELLALAHARLTKQGIAHTYITGDVSEIDRARAKQEFQAGQARVILLTYGAGSESITLTAAAHVCFLQPSPSRTKKEQGEDRVYRWGQERDVQPIHIISRGTVEERALERGFEKDIMVEEIARDADTLRWFLGG